MTGLEHRLTDWIWLVKSLRFLAWDTRGRWPWPRAKGAQKKSWFDGKIELPLDSSVALTAINQRVLHAALLLARDRLE